MAKYFARCGVRTHALIRVPELKSGALDRSANLACCEKWVNFMNQFRFLKNRKLYTPLSFKN